MYEDNAPSVHLINAILARDEGEAQIAEAGLPELAAQGDREDLLR